MPLLLATKTQFLETLLACTKILAVVKGEERNQYVVFDKGSDANANIFLTGDNFENKNLFYVA